LAKITGRRNVKAGRHPGTNNKTDWRV